MILQDGAFSLLLLSLDNIEGVVCINTGCEALLSIRPNHFLWKGSIRLHLGSKNGIVLCKNLGRSQNFPRAQEMNIDIAALHESLYMIRNFPNFIYARSAKCLHTVASNMTSHTLSSMLCTYVYSGFMTEKIPSIHCYRDCFHF